jgi:transposase-like protein
MLRERGLTVDHVTVFRWVQRYAPEINRRMRPHLKMSGTSYRLDETYVKVGTEWKYLYRAVDSAGDTIEFRLRAKRDVSAATRFPKKLINANAPRHVKFYLRSRSRDLLGGSRRDGRSLCETGGQVAVVRAQELQIFGPE